MQEEAPKAKRLEFEASGKLKSTTIVSGHKGTTVIVENLFYNLPVRRRELERNIKREWGKVISLLNQYACVQTGVKFSVSQQPTKGKRMLLFSTKGNLTTRDNIINVFGVKSTAALINLDLSLELVPTHNPLHKRKADDDDDGTREIRVKGHVSRPTHGEGRQTPDRQMFYVNGRPCGLPQFAKVFNEVYRSYNSSQSPFIFADIQLDTHLYDVNVSPDKRTILLHEQGQMLDNLREALIELFEKQDVTVPSSQLLTGKQTPYKKPGIVRRDTPGSARSESTRASPPTKQHSSAHEDDEDHPQPAREEESEDDDEDTSDGGETNLRLSVTNRNGRRASAKRVSAADNGAQNLISRWVGKKSDGQGPATSRNTPTVFKAGRQTTPGQQSILAAFRSDHKPPASSVEEEEPLSPAEEPDEAPSSMGDGATELERHEPPIPAIAPLSQPRPTLPPSTSSPRRPEQQVATIRIGDQEVTGVIVAPPKRPRTDSAPVSPAKKRVAKAAVPLPSFGGRLTQLFAAGNASLRRSAEGSDDDVGDAADEEEENDETDEPVESGDPDVEEEDDYNDPRRADREDSLFVTQEEEQSRLAADEEPETVDRDPTDEARSEPDEDEPDDRVASEDGEGGSERASDIASDELDHTDADGDYVDRDEAGPEDPEEAASVEPSEDSLKRQQMLLKGAAKRKDSTVQYLQNLRTNESSIREQFHSWQSSLAPFSSQSSLHSSSSGTGRLDADDAEEKLSLKISKSDFGQMRIVGQFNLGFIIAVREKAALAPTTESSSSSSSSGGRDPRPSDSGRHQDDEVFIIDQHASDEKFNFERLQATTVVQSQRLVQPKTLELTAVEEEVIMENLPALESNGFKVRVDDGDGGGGGDDGSVNVGSRVQLLSLPLSRETTFGLADLEELIFLLGENASSSATTGGVLRPSKVRKMFAMRACRSSIMIGKALSDKQMAGVVRHMGEMEKPWNCPHGRPTMRHLCGLGEWDVRGWREGGETGDATTDWAGWLAAR
jgi:DNA mismatch repair protein PMS2